MGVIAVTQMAVGDGLADIVGRRWGTVKWPFAGGKKSVIGSAAFVLGSFVVSAALLLLLQVRRLPFPFTRKAYASFLTAVDCRLQEVRLRWTCCLLLNLC